MQKSFDHEKENEIDLRSLFQLIVIKKYFIVIFVVLGSVIGAVYSYKKPVIYTSTAFIEIGYISNKSNEKQFLEDPVNIITKIRLKKANGISFDKTRRVKNSNNLIKIVASGKRSDVKRILEDLIIEIIKEHNLKINNYKSFINKNIESLENQKKLFKEETNDTDILSIKFNINSKITNLKLKISDYNLETTKKISPVVSSHSSKKTIFYIFMFAMAGFILSIIFIFLQNINNKTK